MQSDAKNSIAQVAAAAERLRLAMIDPTPAALDALLHEALSYGHSNARLDTKDELIDDLMQGRSNFLTIAIGDQTIRVDGDVAIVRHGLVADTCDSGQPGHVSLHVLGIWRQRTGGDWQLFARQAVRLAPKA